MPSDEVTFTAIQPSSSARLPKQASIAVLPVPRGPIKMLERQGSSGASSKAPMISSIAISRPAITAGTRPKEGVNGFFTINSSRGKPSANTRQESRSIRTSFSLDSILYILNHYAIFCAPLNITQSLVHLRSPSITFDHLDALRTQTAVVLHPLARRPQHAQRP